MNILDIQSELQKYEKAACLYMLMNNIKIEIPHYGGFVSGGSTFIGSGWVSSAPTSSAAAFYPIPSVYPFSFNHFKTFSNRFSNSIFFQKALKTLYDIYHLYVPVLEFHMFENLVQDIVIEEDGAHHIVYDNVKPTCNSFTI